MDALPVGKTCRAVKLLDIRSFELKSDVHEVFDHVWKALVNVDIDNGSIAIYDNREGLTLKKPSSPTDRIDDEPDEQMSLRDAVIGLKAYKEVEERMEQLWHNLDAAIVSPRLNTDATSFLSVKVESVSSQSFSC